MNFHDVALVYTLNVNVLESYDWWFQIVLRSCAPMIKRVRFGDDGKLQFDQYVEVPFKPPAR